MGGAVTEFQERTAELNPGGFTVSAPVAIGEDGPGELYIVSVNGDIHKIVPETPVDCNANGTPDGCDIASGTSNDADYNGVPDECQSPPVPTLGEGSLALLSFLLAGAGARRLRTKRS